MSHVLTFEERPTRVKRQLPKGLKSPFPPFEAVFSCTWWSPMSLLAVFSRASFFASQVKTRDWGTHVKTQIQDQSFHVCTSVSRRRKSRQELRRYTHVHTWHDVRRDTEVHTWKDKYKTIIQVYVCASVSHMRNTCVCVFMCVCVGVCVRVHVFTCVYVRVCVRVHTHTKDQ